MGGPTLAGFCLLDSFKQQLSGRRPEEAKRLFLCLLPIGRRFRLLSGCVETIALSKAAKEGQPPGECVLSLSGWRVLRFERASA